MNDETKIEWSKRFNEVIQNEENYSIITRSIDLQRESVERINDLLRECEKIKIGIVASGEDEHFANLLLACECAATYLANEIAMWVSLKEGDPDRAWDHLVSAQVSVWNAMRAHEAFTHLEHHAQRLEVFEEILFPPQVFVSSGLLVGRQECSVCGNEYGKCDHLVGRPYWGEFCSIIAREIELNHVAIVKDPADKACRITQFSVEGGQRNRMTWNVTPDENEGDTANSRGSDGEFRAIASVMRAS